MLIKICGINEADALAAAVAAGATHLGFVFYPPSPRAVTPEQAAALARLTPGHVTRVALLVDPKDSLIEAVTAALAPGLLQLHGAETPDRIDAIKARFGLPVMKAVRVATAADARAAARYDGHADWLLFDAKPPPGLAGALPGGNGLVFDWQLLSAYRGATPWLLSGGLSADNVGDAIRQSGATGVDTSSGVEDRPGRKNPERIRAFLRAAQRAAATA